MDRWGIPTLFQIFGMNSHTFKNIQPELKHRTNKSWIISLIYLSLCTGCNWVTSRPVRFCGIRIVSVSESSLQVVLLSSWWVTIVNFYMLSFPDLCQVLVCYRRRWFLYQSRPCAQDESMGKVLKYIVYEIQILPHCNDILSTILNLQNDNLCMCINTHWPLY